ncbi:MAG: TolC family protein [Armatimonadota bacterium]
MNHAIRSILIMLLAFGLAGTASADTPVSLQQAVNMAIERNPNFQASKTDVEAAKANERGARALANLDITVTPGIAGNAGSDEVLSVVQPLEINGQRKIRSRIAQAETQAAEAVSKSAERDLILSVKQAYWDIAQAQSAVDLNIENVKLAESLYQSAVRQRDVGTAPGSQVIKSQVELTRTKQDLARAESDLLQAKSVLNTFLAHRPDTPIDISDKLVYKPLTLDTSAMPATAEANRPEIQESQAVLLSRKGEIDAAKALRRPDLALQLRQESFGGEGGLGIGISLPLLDWGSTRAERKRAEEAANAQQQRIEALRNSIAMDVDSALRDIRQSELLISQYQDGVLSQVEQLFEMAQKGFTAGATGYLDVLEAQRTLRSTKADYYTALADHRKALAQLEWALGTDITAVAAKETTE